MNQTLIYQGEVWHARLSPVDHSFQYPVYFFAFRLSELKELSKQVRFFSYSVASSKNSLEERTTH